MLELRGVAKQYGETQALYPTDLTVEAGTTVALLGPSGCGKSTLLRIVVGLVEPTEGEVIFKGERVTRDNLRLIRHQIGYMIQDGGLFPHLTIGDNCALLARHLRRDENWIRDRQLELVQLVDLPEGAIDRFPTQVSGGQRQRAALMRALFLDPAMILLDEPMGALDPLIRSELQAELRDIFKRLDKTVLMVSHDIGEAAFLAHRLVLLKYGRIAQIGSLRDLVESPADKFVADFINAQRSPLESLGPAQGAAQ